VPGRLAHRNNFPDVSPRFSLESELHDQQIGWAAEQAAGLQEYFRRKDPTAVVRGEWPLLPIPHQQDGDL
jgi:hypothetical protein